MEVHIESIIDDTSAILNSLLDKLKEPSLHCRSSNNEDRPNNAELPMRLHDCSVNITWMKVQIDNVIDYRD